MNAERYAIYLDLLIKNKCDEAIQFRKQQIPKYIYKFYSLSSKTGKGKLDIQKLRTLKDNQIWCSRLSEFNDPFEGIGLYYKGYDREKEMELASPFLAASFSEDAASNVSMWAYYANQHKGFCVQYEVLDSKSLYDITYLEERINVNYIIAIAAKKMSNGQSVDTENWMLYEKYLTKHISWENEKEYRILIADSGKKHGQGVACERIGLHPRKIYAGINCHSKVKKKLNRISKHLGCGGIIECEINSDKFLFLKGNE